MPGDPQSQQERHKISKHWDDIANDIKILIRTPPRVQTKDIDQRNSTADERELAAPVVGKRSKRLIEPICKIASHLRHAFNRIAERFKEVLLRDRHVCDFIIDSLSSKTGT